MIVVEKRNTFFYNKREGADPTPMFQLIDKDLRVVGCLQTFTEAASLTIKKEVNFQRASQRADEFD
jgi:hypothetical protein